MNDVQRRLSAAVHKLLDSTKMPPKVGIGIEIEFFLRDISSGALANLDCTQLFLTELANLKSWKVFQTNPQTGKILKVSKELEGSRYQSVKYEHPPHLMEVAIAYEHDLFRLRDSVVETLDKICIAAATAGLRVSISSKSEIPKLMWNEVLAIDSKYKVLSDSRRIIFSKCAKQKPDDRIDFPQYVAATQYHLGGIRWWKDRPNLFDSIYKAEFLISGDAYTGDRQAFLDRWNLYKYVFRGLPLVGYPQFSTWTFDSWVQSLGRMPFTDNTYVEFYDLVKNQTDAQLFQNLLNVRDLQLVKPKWIGTIEYRSDPATDDLQKIMKQAASRLGVYSASDTQLTGLPFSHLPLSELSDQWWSGSHVSAFSKERDVLKEIISSSLKSRGYKEEKFL